MIFIGPELNDPHAHFVTNIVHSIGDDQDLIIDLWEVQDASEIFDLISAHIKQHDEQFVVYNAYEDEDFARYFKSHFPQLKLVVVFSDDEWRHSNYDRYLANYADLFTIAVMDHLQRYHALGLDPFYMQWACNPAMFYPLAGTQQDIDVSFIGAAYGQRIETIQYLIANGINVQVFGRGWDRLPNMKSHWGGYVTHQQLLEVIARSRINLNFLWTSADEERSTIKGRTLELSACAAFQLSNHTDEFVNYGFEDGSNIAVFSDREEMLKKINHYLTHESERQAIAESAYEHVLKNHTWVQRFDAIFERLSHPAEATGVAPGLANVMVVTRVGMRHKIIPQDTRLQLHMEESGGDWQRRAGEMDGVIVLEHHSDMNNESLYLMVFGLLADQSNVIIANFYEESGAGRCWIRFKDRQVERRRNLVRLLPLDCMMFAGGYICQSDTTARPDLSAASLSFMEYPTFTLTLSYLRGRLLRLYFSHFSGARRLVIRLISKLKLLHALSICLDKIWQRFTGLMD